MKRPIGLIVCLIVCVWSVVAGAQSESAGVAQYFNNCASCHERTDAAHQAPRTAVLKQMTPEHVLDVLTNGSMRSNAAALSDADKRVSEAYGVLDEAEAVAFRATFIINPAGLISYEVVSHVNVGRSVEETLRVLKALRTDRLCPSDWQPGESTGDVALKY